MTKTLTVVGGTYFEVCIEPQRKDLFGSGLRGAAAISGKGFNINFFSCLGRSELQLAESLCETFTIIPNFQLLDKTVTFGYYHPLTVPECINLNKSNLVKTLPTIQADCILYYGLIETNVSVFGDYVVYDPQNHSPFLKTGSTANHLALVLNRKEAYLLSGCTESTPIAEVCATLRAGQNAEVVVIKDGPRGAWVSDSNGESVVPVFQTPKVWPIGSGDIFSAVFAWQWAILKKEPLDAAMLSSQYTATFCSTELLPLPETPTLYKPTNSRAESKKIYLAGPFFTMAQRWLVNEFRTSLNEFGNNVFSPFHDVGLAFVDDENSETGLTQMANADLNAIHNADLVVAIICDKDPGTLFEVGYARALGKEVLIYSENVSDADLFMMYGSDCKIVSDFSTAIYMASW